MDMGKNGIPRITHSDHHNPPPGTYTPPRSPKPAHISTRPTHPSISKKVRTYQIKIRTKLQPQLGAIHRNRHNLIRITPLSHRNRLWRILVRQFQLDAGAGDAGKGVEGEGLGVGVEVGGEGHIIFVIIDYGLGLEGIWCAGVGVWVCL